MPKSTKIALWLLLPCLLGVAAIVTLGARLAGVSLSAHGIVAISLGAFLSLLVSIGLFALSFHSSRTGYDRRPHGDDGPDMR